MCRQKKAAAQFQLTCVYTVEIGNNSKSGILCGVIPCTKHVGCKRRDNWTISKRDGLNVWQVPRCRGVPRNRMVGTYFFHKINHHWHSLSQISTISNVNLAEEEWGLRSSFRLVLYLLQIWTWTWDAWRGGCNPMTKTMPSPSQTPLPRCDYSQQRAGFHTYRHKQEGGRVARLIDFPGRGIKFSH